MIPEVYKTKISVDKTAIDERNHVNNLVYLQWCLDAAEAHWNQNTSEEIRKRYIWYVLNHNISYRASAFEGDTLHVETWVASSEGVKSERHYKIVRPKDGAILVKAQTLWCLLDSKTLKPTKITEEIRTLFYNQNPE